MTRVMLVDDNKPLIENWAELLQMDGYEVTRAHDGRQALEALASDPQIIFCDYNMPIMNGGEFVRQIQNQPQYERYRQIPIVGIGDFPDDKRANIREFLTKPIPSSEFIRCINRYCIQ